MAMTWVMVPVPDELVPQVQALLYQLRYKAQVPQFDEAAMGEHLLSLEDEPRAVLSKVAAGVVAGDPIEDAQLAEQLGVGLRELSGLVMEANDVTVRAFPGSIMFFRGDQVDDGAGATRRRRVLYMLPGFAQAVANQEIALGLRRRPSLTT